jgi:integrase
VPTMKMTPGKVAALPAPDPSGKQTIYWAEGTTTPGLGILVSGISPSKSWVCQGNLPNGKSRRITLGPVAVLSIDGAYKEARPKLAAMLQGRDPKLTVSQRQLASMTVAEVLDDYLTANSNLRSTTIRMYRKSAQHLGPLLNRTMREISADQVDRQFRMITSIVAARRERGEIKGGVNVTGKAIANCAARLFGSLWEFQAERDNGLDENGKNPVRGRRFEKQWHKLDRRNRMIPTDRLADFYKEARHLPSDIQRDLVLFGLFSGMREREAAGLRWDEVDLTNRLLHLPEGRMKGKKALKLPMSDLVHQILLARRTIGREGSFVFPGYGKSGHCESFTYALSQIGDVTGIKVSPHDLRRTYASVAATCSIPPIALKMLIAHSTGSDVTDGYTILTPEQLRDAAQVVANRFGDLCGIVTPTGENVAQFSLAVP